MVYTYFLLPETKVSSVPAKDSFPSGT
jgi:hypothetical protein